MTTEQLVAQDKMEKAVSKLLAKYNEACHPRYFPVTIQQKQDGSVAFSYPTDNQPVKPNAR